MRLENTVWHTLHARAARTSPDLYFFDSFANSSADPGLINVPGHVVFLNEIVEPDDGILDLAIPFAAGQQLSITYGQLSVGLPGNGGRLQRIIVAPVPEPVDCVLLASGVAMLLCAGRRQR